MFRKSMFLATAVALLVVCAATVRAQTTQTPAPGWGSTRLQATRAELTASLTEFDKAAKDPGYTSKMRDKARAEAALIKQRLEQGDFQVGDQLVLLVDKEPAFSDSVVVSQELTVALKTGDTLSLKGVLRSELEARFLEAARKVIRDPTVHTQSFLRLAVTGAVGQQGYFTVRAESSLSDVLMAANGTGASAKLTDIRVERGSKVIWDGEPLQAAITEGRTLDQLSLRAGDRIVVPQEQQGNNLNGGRGGILGTMRAVRGLLIAVPLVLALVRAL